MNNNNNNNNQTSIDNISTDLNNLDNFKKATNNYNSKDITNYFNS